MGSPIWFALPYDLLSIDPYLGFLSTTSASRGNRYVNHAPHKVNPQGRKWEVPKRRHESMGPADEREVSGAAWVLFANASPLAARRTIDERNASCLIASSEIATDERPRPGD